MSAETDTSLNNIVRSLALEVERLCGRVEHLEADNRLLRFELQQQARHIDNKKAREMELRDSTFTQELNHAREQRIVFEGCEHTVEERMAALEERLAYLEAKDNKEDNAIALTKCLCCMTPNAKLGRRPSNPGSGANHSRFLSDMTAFEVQHQQLQEQQGLETSELKNGGQPQRRAPRFGVESIRPRSRG
jgi:hypothetical protein